MARINLLLATLTMLVLASTSCSFNHAFFQPDVIPQKAKGLTATFTRQDTHETDTQHTYITGPNHQPLFTHNRKDTIDPGYNIESVVFKSSSGSDLNGWMMTPRQNALPITILHLHGNAGNLYSQFQFMAPLVKKGFRVFVFDYSGFGFSTGKANKENVLQDALSALDYVKSRPEVKDSKLVIYGQSMGGHLSAVVAEKRQQDIDGLVMEGAFSSMGDIAAYEARHMFLLGFVGRTLVTKPYSAKSSLERFHKPVLIVHSTEDEVIPYFMGPVLYQHANEPKSFYEIKGGHIRAPQLYTDSIANKIQRLVTLR